MSSLVKIVNKNYALLLDEYYNDKVHNKMVYSISIVYDR